MAEWQVGDLALCVHDHAVPWGWKLSTLRKGQVAKVAKVGPTKLGRTGLVLSDFDWEREFVSPFVGAWRFIKVTPPDADEFDRETIALLTGAGQDVGA